MTMSRVRASIDIGSNSFILLIAEIEGQKIREFLYEDCQVVGLGENLNIDPNFSEPQLSRSKEVLTEFSGHLKKHRVAKEDIIVSATEAARVAKNVSQLGEMILDILGVGMTILTPEQEAQYSIEGLLTAQGLPSEFTMVDLGGASTEFLNFHDGKADTSISLEIGSVRYKGLCASEEEENYWNEKISKCAMDYETKPLILGVAGTLTALAAIYRGAKESYDPEMIEGKEIISSDFFEICERVWGSNESELIDSHPFLGRRVHSIRYGAKVFNQLFPSGRYEKIQFSNRGLRHGTLLHQDDLKGKK